MLHPVPKGLKAQIGVITEVVDHAPILPSAVLDLEQLHTHSGERSRRPKGLCLEKTSGVDRPGTWEQQGDDSTEATESNRARKGVLGITASGWWPVRNHEATSVRTFLVQTRGEHRKSETLTLKRNV